MTVLDTDHVTALQFAGAVGERLQTRLDPLEDQQVTITIVTVEEQLRGWLASVHAQRSIAAQVPFYARLASLVSYFASWTLLPFDDAAAREYERLRKIKVRVGTMDLKIAAISLCHRATLLSANLSDFKRVPGLDVQDWLQD